MTAPTREGFMERPPFALRIHWDHELASCGGTGATASWTAAVLCRFSWHAPDGKAQGIGKSELQLETCLAGKQSEAWGHFAPAMDR